MRGFWTGTVIWTAILIWALISHGYGQPEGAGAPRAANMKAALAQARAALASGKRADARTAIEGARGLIDGVSEQERVDYWQEWGRVRRDYDARIQWLVERGDLEGALGVARELKGGSARAEATERTERTETTERTERTETTERAGAGGGGEGVFARVADGHLRTLLAEKLEDQEGRGVRGREMASTLAEFLGVAQGGQKGAAYTPTLRALKAAREKADFEALWAHGPAVFTRANGKIGKGDPEMIVDVLSTGTLDAERVIEIGRWAEGTANKYPGSYVAELARARVAGVGAVVVEAGDTRSAEAAVAVSRARAKGGDLSGALRAADEAARAGFSHGVYAQLAAHWQAGNAQETLEYADGLLADPAGTPSGARLYVLVYRMRALAALGRLAEAAEAADAVAAEEGWRRYEGEVLAIRGE